PLTHLSVSSRDPRQDILPKTPPWRKPERASQGSQRRSRRPQAIHLQSPQLERSQPRPRVAPVLAKKLLIERGRSRHAAQAPRAGGALEQGLSRAKSWGPGLSWLDLPLGMRLRLRRVLACERSFLR